MTNSIVSTFSRKILCAFLALACLAAHPGLAANDTLPLSKGAAVSVLKATRACFDDIVEVSGIVIARDERAVRPERPGLKVAEVMADAGESVQAGQVLARLSPPEGGSINVQAPVGGVISASTASVGALASPRGEALFSIIANNEYDLVGTVPVENVGKLAPNQTADIHVIGAGELQGIVRRVAPTVESNSQLGQVDRKSVV